MPGFLENLPKLSQEEMDDMLENALDHGTKAIKNLIQVIWDEDRMDLEACYRRESAIEQRYRQEENLPPLNLPLGRKWRRPNHGSGKHIDVTQMLPCPLPGTGIETFY